MKRIQLSFVDVDRETRRRIKAVAAYQEVSVGEYIRRAIKGRLEQDLKELERNQIVALHAQTDPVLAELWDNVQDAAYDKL